MMASKGRCPHVGVLAVQGNVREHEEALSRLGCEVTKVKSCKALESLDGLIIPGGESTTIRKLLKRYDLFEALKNFAKAKPVMGTCAGAILLAKNLTSGEETLEVMDMTIERNAFGAQINSFEEDLNLPNDMHTAERNSFHAVFIRGPVIRKTKGRCQALASLPNGTIIAASEPVENGRGAHLALSFHPEMTDDLIWHEWFCSQF